VLKTAITSSMRRGGESANEIFFIKIKHEREISQIRKEKNGSGCEGAATGDTGTIEKESSSTNPIWRLSKVSNRERDRDELNKDVKVSS